MSVFSQEWISLRNNRFILHKWNCSI